MKRIILVFWFGVVAASATYEIENDRIDMTSAHDSKIANNLVSDEVADTKQNTRRIGLVAAVAGSLIGLLLLPRKWAIAHAFREAKTRNCYDKKCDGRVWWRPLLPRKCYKKGDLRPHAGHFHYSFWYEWLVISRWYDRRDYESVS
ncbi:hypothetical protein JW872_03055 [Candidatus Babeliales bacterium]|nr:hypothetical protein [Candidatus Babeliales bacterium]